MVKITATPTSNNDEFGKSTIKANQNKKKALQTTLMFTDLKGSTIISPSTTAATKNVSSSSSSSSVKKKRKPRAPSGTKEGETIYNKLLAEGNNNITREHFINWFVSYKQKMKNEAAASKRASGATISQPALKLTASKRKAILKAVKSTLRKGITAKKFYNYGSSNTCNAQALMSPFEFQEIFGAVGGDAGSSSSSVVTKKWLKKEDVENIFGALFEGMKTKTFNRPRMMRKQYSTGSQPVTVHSGELTYSKNTNNCKFKFQVSNQGSDDGYGGYGFW